MTTRYSNIYSKLYSNTGAIELKGTGTNRLIIEAPALSQNVTLVFPSSVGDIGQALVNSSTPGTLTWADFSNEFSDGVFRIKNSTTSTKKIAFSAATIAADTTRTITMPNSDVDLQYVPNQSVSTSASPTFVGVTVGAGLEATPSITFSSNTNTGIYKINTNNIGISTNGVKRVDIGDTALSVSSGVISTFNDTTDSTATNDGSVILKGGLGIAKTLVPNTLKMTNSVTMIDTDATLAANSSTRLPTQSAVRQFVLDECTAIDNPTGFLPSAKPTLSMVGTVLTLTAPYTYYIKGVKYIKSADETITLTGSPNPSNNVTFVYYDGETLSQTASYSDDLILNKVMVAWIYWNKTTNSVVVTGNELHGCSMSPYTHLNLHKGQGTIWGSGGSLADFTIGTGNAANVQFSVSSCTVWDEDLELITNIKTQTGLLRLLYIKTTSGVNEWTMVTSDGAYHVTGNQLQYNRNNAGVWSLAVVPNNNYVLGHIFACNDISGTIYALMGQSLYTTLGNAQSGANTELSTLLLTNLPELVFIGTVIYKSLTGAPPYAAIVQVSTGVNYVDWRQKKINSSAGQVASHSNLSGLSNDDHLQYSKVVGRTTDTLTLNYAGTSTSPSAALLSTCTDTLAQSITSGYCGGISITPTYAGDGFAVTKHNYLVLNNPVMTGTSTVTDAVIAKFDANAGTHKAVSGGNSGILGTTSGWLKYSINGTLAYSPVYSSITPSMPEMHTRAGTLSTVGGTTTILTLSFSSNSDKDTCMFILDAIAIDTAAGDSVYTVEALRTNRVIRRISSTSLEETKIFSESNHTAWTLGPVASSTNYTIVLNNPASGRTVGYNLRMFIQYAVGTYPTVT